MKLNTRSIAACIGLAAALLVLVGCRTGSPVEAHRDARLHFERGQYRKCIRACDRWLKRYSDAQPDLAPSARFYKGLSYKEMGETTKARRVFEDIISRYQDVPGTHPAAQWRGFAREQLNLLGE